MDRGKDGNRNANGGLAEATASRLRFDSDEEAEEVEMEVEEGPDAEGEEEQAAEVIGSDKTSADYYFDSYSHFGTRTAAARFRQDAVYFTADLDAISINLHRKKIESGDFCGAKEVIDLFVSLNGCSAGERVDLWLWIRYARDQPELLA